MITYRLWISIEMQDTEDVGEPPTIIEERDFVCADHEEAQKFLAAAENAVEGVR